MSESMKALSLSEIESTDDIDYAYVPAFGSHVRLGSLSAGAMIDWSEANEGPAKRKAGLRMIALSLVDDDGHRIGGNPEGTEDEKVLFEKTTATLATKNHETINRLVGEVLKLNGIDIKKAVQAKNDSSEAASVASPTS